MNRFILATEEFLRRARLEEQRCIALCAETPIDAAAWTRRQFSLRQAQLRILDLEETLDKMQAAHIAAQGRAGVAP